MPPRRFLALFLIFFQALPGLAPAGSDREKAQAARAILDAYHGEDPVPGSRKLHVVCWRPVDRPFADGYRERIPRMLDHIRDFYESEMERHGLGKRTFQLDTDEEGKLVIHEAVGEGNYEDYGRPDGQRIRKDCVVVLKEAGLDPDRETILIFTNLSDWDPVKRTFFHKSPYYAGGSHRSGTAWQLDSAELDTRNLALKEPMIRDGEYGRISLGKHNSIFIGGIAHEMGHAFGLPHCRARDDEAKAFGTALMGAGNRTYADELRGEGKGSFLTLASALRLASHPQFSGSVKGMNLPLRAEFTDMAVEGRGDSFVLRGKVEAGLPVYAVLGYLDPEGGGDYDSRTVVAIPGDEGEFTLECDALVPGKEAEVRLFTLMVNGDTQRWTSGYRVARDGTVDVEAMETTLELSDFVAAVRERDLEEAKRIGTTLAGDAQAARVARSILAGLDPERTTRKASEIPEETRSFPLSRITPTEAEVGWQRPAYDHLPGPAVLIQSGAEVFETGIYAHAEARHVYTLNGGGWKRLRGQCGLPHSRGGSVEFVIRTDGNEVFRSKTLKAGEKRPFDVDLSGVTRLELLTRDGGDGKGADWGFWLAPMLVR